MRLSIATICILSLPACGGGGGGNDTPSAGIPGFADTTSQASASLTAVALTSTTRSTEAQTGTLDRANDSFEVGLLIGEINAGRTEVTLDGGGVLTLNSDGTLYAVRFSATPLVGDAQSGIVGIAALEGSLPNSGNVTYSGTSVVTIQEGLTVYDLSGNATVIASFGSGMVTTTIDSLNGVATAGLNDPTDVSNVAEITFAGSSINGTTFGDGTLNLTSDTISDLSTGAVGSLDGAFFGPGGVETGGVFVVDDTDAGDIIIFGDFIAQ